MHPTLRFHPHERLLIRWLINKNLQCWGVDLVRQLHGLQDILTSVKQVRCSGSRHRSGVSRFFVRFLPHLHHDIGLAHWFLLPPPLLKGTRSTINRGTPRSSRWRWRRHVIVLDIFTYTHILVLRTIYVFFYITIRSWGCSGSWPIGHVGGGSIGGKYLRTYLLIRHPLVPQILAVWKFLEKKNYINV